MLVWEIEYQDLEQGRCFYYIQAYNAIAAKLQFYTYKVNVKNVVKIIAINKYNMITQENA